MTWRTSRTRSAVATDEAVNNSLEEKISQQVHWTAFPQASPEDGTGLASQVAACLLLQSACTAPRERPVKRSEVQACKWSAV